MKEKSKKESDAIRMEMTHRGVAFVKDLLNFCEKEQINPILIAEVLNALTEGVVISIVATKKGMNDEEFLKLLNDKYDEPNKKLGTMKLIEAILKSERNDDEITYRS